MIELTNISKVYDTPAGPFRAIDGVTLSIGSGDIFGIIGESGAGKSTLVRCINLLEKPTSGTVAIDGRDVTSLRGRDLRELRADIGMIFQRFSLFDQRTVLDNVIFPATLASTGKRVSRAEAPERARKLLALVGLEGKEGSYPSQLSGGQQQRVAIARALITKPKLVFADEPTGNLDSVSSAEVLGFLKRSVNELGQTIVMVTHDAVAASYADRAIVFADGQIVADEANPTAETMNELLMAERERATRTAVTSTRADTLARLAGVKDVPNLPITDAPLPPAGRTGTMRHARAAAQHAR